MTKIYIKIHEKKIAKYEKKNHKTIGILLLINKNVVL